MALLYHEKQIGALCGQHALNNLLQGPYVTVDLLVDIARELQERERKLMLSEGADTPDALQYLAQDSNYIDDSGNFSVEVLREALRRSHGLELVLATSPAVQARLDDPTCVAPRVLRPLRAAYPPAGCSGRCAHLRSRGPAAGRRPSSSTCIRTGLPFGGSKESTGT